MAFALRDFLTGPALKDAVTHSAEERPSLIDGLLYERASLMIAGDPGLGKSLVVLCALAQATTGSPVFGQLPCVRPLNCYCMFSERVNQEALERLRLMGEHMTIDYERLLLDDGYVGIADVTRRDFATEMRERISAAHFKGNEKADIVALDSLYGFVPGGLSRDEKASEFARFISRLVSELGLSLALVHHTSKDTYAGNTGQKIEKDDPGYGSQWLKAMVTGYYHLRSDGDTGVRLVRKKDTFSGLLKEIPLSYDPQSHIVTMPVERGTATASERAVQWLMRVASDNPSREFDFNEFCVSLSVSHQQGRRLLTENAVKSRLSLANRNGNKHLYRAVPAVSPA